MAARARDAQPSPQTAGPPLDPATSAFAPPFSDRRLAVVAVLIVFLGFALRAWRVTAFSITSDELDTLLFARMSLRDLFAALATHEPHPPLYYLSLHGWVALTGQSELALRYPSVLFGTLAVAAAYNAGRSIGGIRVGLATSAILAASQFSVLHSQEARMYPMLQACAALFLAALVHYVNKPTRTNGAYLAGVGLLAAYTHYDGLLVVALGAIPVVWSTLRRRAPAQLWPFVVMAVVYLPWVSYARQIFFVYRGWMGVVPPLEIFRRSALVYSVGVGVDGIAGRVAIVILPLLALAGVAALASRREWRSLGILFCLGVLPLVAVILGSATGRALYNERYLIVITPAYFALAGLGLTLVSRSFVVRPVAIAAIAGLAFVSLSSYYWPASPMYPDGRGTVALIDRNASANAAVVLPHPQSPVVTYYLQDRLPTYVAPDFPPPGVVDADLASRLPGHDEAWFVRYPLDPGDEAIARWLEANAFFVGDQWVTTNHVLTYALPLGGDVVETPSTARLADGTTISAVDRGPVSVRPGGRVLAGFRWTPGAGPSSANPSTTKVSLRLIDPWGQTVGALDRQLVDPAGLVSLAAPSTWRGALTVPDDAVPGAYRVEARFYDEQTGQIATITDASSGARLTLDLGPTTVSPADAASLARAPALAPSAMPLGNGLFAQNVALSGAPYSQHSHLIASFDWASQTNQAGPLVPELGLQSSSGELVASTRREEVDQPYPLRQLRAGERVRERLDLPLRTVGASGTYRVVLRIGDRAAWIPIGSIDVAVDQKPVATAALTSPRSDLFDGVIRLTGVSLPTKPVAAGSSLSVTLGWHADERATISYTVFVHLVRAVGDPPLAQSDGIPDGGKQPTSDWITGDDVVDTHQIALPVTLAPGNYHLVAGLYDATTGRRAQVVGSTPDGQTVDLGTVTVSAP